VPHTVICALLGASLAWFYKWVGRAQGLGAVNGLHMPRDRRRDIIDRAVAVAFRKARGLHGSPRLNADLLDDGWRVSEETVTDSMHRQGLVARRIKRRTPQCHQSRTVRVHAVPPCWSMAGLSSLDAVASWNDSGVDGELVVAAAEVLNEGVATYHYTHPVRSVLSPRIGLSLAFRRPWSHKTRMFCYWPVCATRQESSPRWRRPKPVPGRGRTRPRRP